MKIKIVVALLVLTLLGNMVTVSAGPMDSYQKARDQYGKAREAYMEAREKYMGVESKARDLRNSMTFENAKRFLIAGAEMIERWLERLENLVNNTRGLNDEAKEEILGQIAEYRNIIEEKKNKVINAETPEELREAAREMKTAWMEIRAGIKSIAGQVVVARVNVIIEKAEQVELRIEERINLLKSQGIDTSELEMLLEDYSEKIDLAKENLEKAKEKYKEASEGEDVENLLKEANSFLMEANRYLREAFGDVKQIIRILKSIQSGSVFYGNNTGEVFAAGNGTARVEGTGIVVIKGNGVLEVTPGDAVVSITGFGEKSRSGSTITYEGQGKAVVRGKDISVKLEGEHIRLYAKGYGTLYLEGTGVYKVKKLPDMDMTDEIEYSGSVTIEFGGEE
jgi:hypothetical protein